MTLDDFTRQVESLIGHTPTTDQHAAVVCLGRFLADRHNQTVMILRGSAGTGKTTVASAIVRTLRRLGQRTVLLAPTGRAAKVFALSSGQEANTIHRRIYRQKSLEEPFGLGFNAARNTLFLVDEASMISATTTASFVDSGLSSTSLLDDVVSFVYGGQGCRLLLIGDPAQLPPVGEESAPALSTDTMSSYGMHVYEATLNEVVRQSTESGILWNATRLRHQSPNEASGMRLPAPRIRFRGFADVVRVTGDELIEQMASSYSLVGEDETMVVTRSNKRANVYNQGIRATLLGREDELTTGDLLMVVKNKYLPAPNQPTSSSQTTPPEAGLTFIANGDRARVQRVRNLHEAYGFRFAQLWLQFPDYNDEELQTMVLLDTLTSEAPALTPTQSNRLYQEVLADYAHIPRKADRMKMLKEDAHYNALQVKFGYAVTCHKAQGGQWAHVYIDQGYLTADMLTPEYYHWLYTAFTRATEKVFLVNWPETQTDQQL